MERDGTYQKGRRRITSPVTHVKGETVTAVRRDPDAPVPRNREQSSGVVFVNKATGWAVASLLLSLLGGIAYVGTTFFTREAQIEHLESEVRDTSREVDVLRTRNQIFERRIVELETRIENMETRE